MKPDTFAIIALRLMGVGLFVIASWQLMAGLLHSFGEVNPSYLGYFFQKVIAGPLLGLFLAVLLLAFSRRLGQILSRGLES